MFPSVIIRLGAHISDLIDDMLAGDFDYIADGESIYADVDYSREHPHRATELSWTPSAGRGFGPQRLAVAGPKARRLGTVPVQAAVCASPVRPTSRPVTTAARARAMH